jgi:hypothetical protein
MATVSSDDDIAGTGICGRQLYFLDYFPDHYYELDLHRRAATAPGEIPGEPAPGEPDASCDDQNSCTAQTCIGGTTCTWTAAADGTTCTGPNAFNCAPAGTCQAGVCVVPTDVSCEDQDPCTTDACDGAGGCVHVPLPAFEGVACLLRQLEAEMSQLRMRRPVVQRVRRLRRLLDRIEQKQMKRTVRSLRRAFRLLDRIVVSLQKDRSLNGDSVARIVVRARELQVQIVSVRTELETLLALRGGRRRNGT